MIILVGKKNNGLKNVHLPKKILDALNRTGHIICTINTRAGSKGIGMGVQLEDRTTIDMFVAAKIGRPRSNPYARDVQIRVNKREQRMRDKGNGMRRMEVKMPKELVDLLDAYAAQHDCSRTEVVALSIREWFAMLEKNND